MYRKKQEKYIFKLFVTGTIPQSMKALQKTKELCELYLKNRYELDVIDVYQNIAAAGRKQIIALPALIRELPRPLRKYIGDVSKTHSVFFEVNTGR
jgi:circadian clock protein KaiB